MKRINNKKVSIYERWEEQNKGIVIIKKPKRRNKNSNKRGK